MKKNNMLITIVLVIVVGAGAFYGGMRYQQNTQTGGFRQFQAGQGQQRFGGMGQGAGRNGFRPVSGDIISADSKSVTVKLADGSSKIVLFSGITMFNKTSTGSASDLKTGEKVMVFGQENADGSVTAQSVQLNPQLREVLRPTGQ